MDNYIIRIYRREKDNPRLLVGLVEQVGVKGRRAFNTLDDLWEILNCEDENSRIRGRAKRKSRESKTCNRKINAER